MPGSKVVRNRSVLAIHRYYWPDAPPYASMLRAIIEHWRLAGFDTEVLSTQPSYKPLAKIPKRPKRELLDGTPVHRIGLPRESHGSVKAINMALFTLAVFCRVMCRRRDVVMCSTSPPVALGAAASLATKLRRGSFIYHCMDLHPEIGALSGEFSNRFVYAALQRIDKATCRRSTAIVVLSEDMRDSLIQRDASIADRIVVLNNFDLPDYSETAESVVALPDPTGRLRLVFAGNLGRFQGLETIVDGLAMVQHDVDVELVFMGEGAAKAGLERAAESLLPGSRIAIAFLPHGTPSDARALMRTADLGLVTLTPQIIRYAYPSKTMTYLAEGLPLLVATETDSQLARTVIDERLGYVVPPLDAQAVAATIRLAVEQRGSLEQMKKAARVYAVAHLTRVQALSRWDRLLSQVSEHEALHV